jgi:hypothetical protein
LKEIALAKGLEISSHKEWIRAERSPARVLRIHQRNLPVIRGSAMGINVNGAMPIKDWLAKE